MQKETYLYKAMKKYRTKFLIFNLIALVLWAGFFAWRFDFIKTEACGPAVLDNERFLKETSTVEIDEEIVLTRHDSEDPESFYYKEITYWQGGNYLFDINVDSIEKTDITFKGSYMAGEKEVEYTYANLWYAKIGDRTVAVIGKEGEKYKNKVTGYLAVPAKAVLAPISATLDKGEKIVIADYVVDCRDIEMETAASDYTFLIIWALALIFFFAKVGAYYAKPYLAPTYRQLAKYGDVKKIADDINAQVGSETAYEEDKQLITDEYILSDSTFKKKVVKNHLK